MSITEIIDRIQRLRLKGKIVHLTPYTAGIIEDVLLEHFAPEEEGDNEPKTPSADRLPYRLEEWSPDGNHIVAVHGALADFEMAKAAWAELIKQKPHDRLTWRQGALVFKEQPWTDKFAKGA